LDGVASFPKTVLEGREEVVSFQEPEKTFIKYLLEEFAKDTSQSYWSVGRGEKRISVEFEDRENDNYFPD